MKAVHSAADIRCGDWDLTLVSPAWLVRIQVLEVGHLGAQVSKAGKKKVTGGRQKHFLSDILPHGQEFHIVISEAQQVGGLGDA